MNRILPTIVTFFSTQISAIKERELFSFSSIEYLLWSQNKIARYGRLFNVQLLYTFLVLLLSQTSGFGQCITYPGGTAVATYTNCIDNTNSITTANVNAGQYVTLNVIKGYNYTFNVGNVFNGGNNETLTVFDASTNVYIVGAYSTGSSGTNFSWTSTISGQIKVVLSKGACLNDGSTGGTLTLTLNSIGNTQDSQTIAGTNTWVGHIYNWTGGPPPGGASPATPTATNPYDPTQYAGYYNIATETINEGFGGNDVCFPVLSNGVQRATIRTAQYAVRYLMNSTSRPAGCYIATIRGDDGVRLYVDGVKVFDQWNEQGPTTYGSLMIYLTGNSNLVLDYYENGGQNEVTFTLTPFVPSSNTVTAPATAVVCSGVTPAVINGSAYLYNGNPVNPTIKFQWQSAPEVAGAPGTWTNVSTGIGQTSQNYTPAAVTGNATTNVTWYRRNLSAVASNAGSCTYDSNAIAITTNAVVTAGAIGISQTICNGTIPATLTSTTNGGGSGTISYEWQTNASGSYVTIGSATAATYSPPALTATTSYQRRTVSVSGGTTCYSIYTAPITITVNAAVTTGTIGTTQTICNGATPSGLTSTTNGTGSGTISYEWQTNASGSYVTIGTATAAAYSPPALTASTSYQRRTVSVNGGTTCYSTYTAPITIAVSAIVTAGTIGTSQTICNGAIPSGLTSTTNGTGSGTISYEWQTNESGSYVTIGSATAATYSPPALTATTSYQRRTVSLSGGTTCYSSYTTPITITVTGLLSNNNVAYANGTSGQVSANVVENGTAVLNAPSGYFTSVNFASYGTPTGTTPNFVIGTCNSTTSVSATEGLVLGNSSASIPATNGIFGDPCSGTSKRFYVLVSYAQPICNGATATVTGSVPTGGTGTYTYQWESSTTSATTGFANAAGISTGINYTSGSLTQTTWFRRIAYSCVLNSTSSVVMVKVNQLPIITDQPQSLTVCANASGSFTVVTSASLPSYQWQYSSNNGGTWIDVPSFAGVSGQTSDTLSWTAAPTTFNGYYLKCIVTSGGCSITSDSAILTVRPVFTAGTISNTGQNICYAGTPSNIGNTTLASGGDSSIIYSWRSSADSYAAAIVGATISTYTPPAGLIATTSYRRYANDGTCNTTPAVSSGTWTVTVTANKTASAASSTPSLCTNTALAEITHTTTGATGIGTATGLPAGVTASFASNTITISGTPTVSGTFNYTIPLTGGCGTVNATGTITVNLAPVTTVLNNVVLLCYDTSATQTWTTVATATNYRYDLSLDPLFGSFVTGYNNLSVASATATVNGLNPGVTYYSRVRTESSCGSSANSNVATLSVPITKTADGGLTWDNGIPDGTQKVIFTGSGTMSSAVNACSCQINAGVNLAVGILGNANTNAILKLENNLDVIGTGTLIFENNASLVQVNDLAVNTGIITYKRNATPMNNFDFTYWSSPVAGQSLYNLSPNTLADKYWSFGASKWVIENPANTMSSIGKGYAIRTPKAGLWGNGENVVFPYAQPVQFIGVPNNGVINVPLEAVGLHNLIGNPYPSAFNAKKFINANVSRLDGTIYLWTHNTPIANKTYAGFSDYAVYTKAGGIKAGSGGVRPDGIIAAGQSFFMRSFGAGPAVFNNSMREGVVNSNAQFFRGTKSKTTGTEPENSRVWLDLSNSEGLFKEMLVGYIEGATNGLDAGYDGKSFNSNKYIDFYSINEASNFSIQGRSLPFLATDEVPLGYKTTIEGTFTISLNEADGVLKNRSIFIEDKATKTIHNLQNGAYSFTTLKGTFNDRFVLVYVDKSVDSPVVVLDPSLENPDFTIKDESVVVYLTNHQIKINSLNETIAKVMVYDLGGRLLYVKTDIYKNEFKIQHLDSSDQFLIVLTQLVNGQWVTKEIIF